MGLFHGMYGSHGTVTDRRPGYARQPCKDLRTFCMVVKVP